MAVKFFLKKSSIENYKILSILDLLCLQMENSELKAKLEKLEEDKIKGLKVKSNDYGGSFRTIQYKICIFLFFQAK